MFGSHIAQQQPVATVIVPLPTMLAACTAASSAPPLLRTQQPARNSFHARMPLIPHFHRTRKHAGNVEKARSLLERGVQAVGYVWEAGPLWDTYVKLEESQYASNTSESANADVPTACERAAMVARRAASVPCEFSANFHKKYLEVRMLV
jgi:hypothetical protein